MSKVNIAQFKWRGTVYELKINHIREQKLLLLSEKCRVE
jgi:hypothetical protein